MLVGVGTRKVPSNTVFRHPQPGKPSPADSSPSPSNSPLSPLALEGLGFRRVPCRGKGAGCRTAARPPPGAAWRLAPLWQPFSAAAWVRADLGEAQAAAGQCRVAGRGAPGTLGDLGTGARPRHGAGRAGCDACRAPAIPPFPRHLVPAGAFPKTSCADKAAAGRRGPLQPTQAKQASLVTPWASTLPYNLPCGWRPCPREGPRAAGHSHSLRGWRGRPHPFTTPPQPSQLALLDPHPSPSPMGLGGGRSQSETERRTRHPQSSESFAF